MNIRSSNNKNYFVNENNKCIKYDGCLAHDGKMCVKCKKVYETMHPDIIDINMGCPVPKVAIKNQAGSALLKNPEKIREIVKKENIDIVVYLYYVIMF